MLGLRLGRRCGARAASTLDAAADAEAAYVKKAVATYKEAQATVDAAMDAKLASAPMVLFMEGTPDAPSSQRSLNVIKMLTQVQSQAFTAVDTTAHPAILGWTASRTGKGAGPQLYMNGTFAGDHDALLRKYQAGGLAGMVGGSAERNTGAFSGGLPRHLLSEEQ